MHRYLQSFLWVSVIGTLLMAVGVFREAEGQDDARDTVSTFYETLSQIMLEAEQLGFTGRRTRLEPVIRSRFDIPMITQLVLGRQHWAELTEQQRSTMQQTFGDLIVATYAARFDSYSGEHFEVTSEQKLRGGRKLVRSKLKRPNETEVQLDYVLHRAEGQWRVINILADGVSDLALKRAAYGSIMRDEGFDSLITQLKDQISELSGNTSPEANMEHSIESRRDV